jgi:hypothetical protein
MEISFFVPVCMASFDVMNKLYCFIIIFHGMCTNGSLYFCHGQKYMEISNKILPVYTRGEKINFPRR